MTENLAYRGDYPSHLLDFSVGNAIQAADVASDMAYGFGRQIPGGWKVQDAAKGVVKAQASLDRAAPYIDVMSGFDDPGAQIGADLEALRGAVEDRLLAHNPGMPPAEAARAVTPDQVAESVGTVLRARLLAPEGDPAALDAPLLRGLASVYARQRLGRNATPADLARKMPPQFAMRAAAPEVLLALGFSPDHPMVASANRGGFVRGAANIFAGAKLRAITRAPELARHVQAMLPPSGEQLRQNFAIVRDFLGAVTTPTHIQR